MQSGRRNARSAQRHRIKAATIAPLPFTAAALVAIATVCQRSDRDGGEGGGRMRGRRRGCVEHCQLGGAQRLWVLVAGGRGQRLLQRQPRTGVVAVCGGLVACCAPPAHSCNSASSALRLVVARRGAGAGGGAVVAVAQWQAQALAQQAAAGAPGRGAGLQGLHLLLQLLPLALLERHSDKVGLASGGCCCCCCCRRRRRCCAGAGGDAKRNAHLLCRALGGQLLRRRQHLAHLDPHCGVRGGGGGVCREGGMGG